MLRIKKLIPYLKKESRVDWLAKYRPCMMGIVVIAGIEYRVVRTQNSIFIPIVKVYAIGIEHAGEAQEEQIHVDWHHGRQNDHGEGAT